jgi:hypothetical protein
MAATLTATPATEVPCRVHHCCAWCERPMYASGPRKGQPRKHGQFRLAPNDAHRAGFSGGICTDCLARELGHYLGRQVSPN